MSTTTATGAMPTIRAIMANARTMKIMTTTVRRGEAVTVPKTETLVVVVVAMIAAAAEAAMATVRAENNQQKAAV